MIISINGKNKFVVKPSLRDYINKKVEGLGELFSERDNVAPKVVCKEYGGLKVVEITIPTKHLIVRAESQAEDFFNAVDLACEKIEKQVIRHKKKINTLIRKRDGISTYFTEVAEAVEQTEKDGKVVKTKELSLEVMSIDEAILQLELLGHDFYMFINEEDHKVSTVYLRNDGDYAIIRVNK